jgi:hypothetical protein
LFSLDQDKKFYKIPLSFDRGLRVEYNYPGE